MLPNGVLAKHGYHVLGGFFSGVCAGAAHPPFEISCDLVKVFVASAEDALITLRERIAALCTPAPATNNPKAMIHVYEKDQRGRGHYHWRECGVITETVRGRDRFFAILPDGERRELSPYDYDVIDVLMACTRANVKFADWLGSEETSLVRYIAWQQNRVKNWAPAALVSVDTPLDKSDDVFTPTKPAYEG